MSDDRQRLIADLKAIAASIRDPTKREEVLKIIARLSPETDTAGGSFELNASAAQRVGMLTGTVRAIILAQGSVPEK